jgi:hypothetical protein
VLSFSEFDFPRYPRHDGTQLMLIPHVEHHKEIVTPRAPVSVIDIERSDYGNDECASY